MEAAETQQWFLRKQEDGTVFGPLAFEQLARWASTAQIAPHDSVSTDQQNWIKAPMLAELGMDWLVEVTSERYYGPTTLGAVFEFMRLGEITPETSVINTCDGTRRLIAELEPPISDFEVAELGSAAPEAEGMSINYEHRMRDLEQSLREERDALRDCEARYRELEARYRELLAQTASGDTLH
jgi:hypothetical protein